VCAAHQSPPIRHCEKPASAGDVAIHLSSSEWGSLPVFAKYKTLIPSANPPISRFYMNPFGTTSTARFSGLLLAVVAVVVVTLTSAPQGI
jgi:hypothetical protein